MIPVSVAVVWLDARGSHVAYPHLTSTTDYDVLCMEIRAALGAYMFAAWVMEITETRPRRRKVVVKRMH